MRSIEPARWGRGTVRSRFPAPLLPMGLLTFVAAALAASHAVFPFFPLLLFALVVATRRFGHVVAPLAGPPAVGASDNSPAALPLGEVGKEKELLRALERHGEITAARAALETSLSVAEAEEGLSRLANEGHVRVSASGGTLQYGLWE